MGHLLTKFMAFGCKNEDYLRSFYRFSKNKREEVLKKILQEDPVIKGAEGAGQVRTNLTKMDLVVLENQLDIFFAER